MHISLTLDVKPLSLNKVFSTDWKTRRRFKSKEYKEFCKEIKTQIKERALAHVELFQKTYNEDEHYLAFSFRFFLPNLFTLKKRVNKKGGDLTNFIKTIEDALADNFGFDDSANFNTNLSKIQSDKCKIEIDIMLRNLKDIL